MTRGGRGTAAHLAARVPAQGVGRALHGAARVVLEGGQALVGAGPGRIGRRRLGGEVVGDRGQGGRELVAQAVERATRGPQPRAGQHGEVHQRADSEAEGRLGQPLTEVVRRIGPADEQHEQRPERGRGAVATEGRQRADEDPDADDEHDAEQVGADERADRGGEQHAREHPEAVLDRLAQGAGHDGWIATSAVIGAK